jgi:hypothetical protein
MFECTNCGYMGYFYIEIDSEDFQLDEEKTEDDNSES